MANGNRFVDANAVAKQLLQKGPTDKRLMLTDTLSNLMTTRNEKYPKWMVVQSFNDESMRTLDLMVKTPKKEYPKIFLSVMATTPAGQGKNCTVSIYYPVHGTRSQAISVESEPELVKAIDRVLANLARSVSNGNEMKHVA